MRLLGVLEVVALNLFVVRHAEGVVVGQGEHQAEGGALHGLAGDLCGVGEGAEGVSGRAGINRRQKPLRFALGRTCRAALFPAEPDIALRNCREGGQGGQVVVRSGEYDFF